MNKKIIVRNMVYAILFFLGGIYFACQSPTGPDLTPGRRDYVWTVDTLHSPGNDLRSIWGSSPNDVWTVGPRGEDDSRLFHFDGTNWKSWPIVCEGNTLYGFNKNDVWMGGNGDIWHFDGNNWTQNFIYKPENSRIVVVEDIWGTNSNDVFAVGVIVYDTDETQTGFILHFDGHTWKEVFKADFYSQFQRIREEDNNIYIREIKVGYTISDTIEFYQLNEGGLTKIYAESSDKIYTASLNMISNKVYFTIGRDVYRYKKGIFGNAFEKRLSFSEPEFGYQVYGKTENDLFVRMNNGLAHYNGTDLVYLQTFTNNFTSINNSPAIFENEVFFCVADYVNRINFVLRGKLKE